MNRIEIKVGHKYQTRNGRMVVIKAIADGGRNAKDEPLPPYGVGELQGEGQHRWSMSGEYEKMGVPHTFDLVLDAGKA
jgi:hypothetical protein